MSDLTSPKQISALLERYGFRFSKALGQNFLVSPHIPVKIAENAGLTPETTVLEIGPGIGSLTRELSLRAKRVLTVEVDPRLYPLLNETLADYPNVTLVRKDILKTDLQKLLEGETDPVVCANLPYNITTPILMHLLRNGPRFRSITVMVQKEVAQRFCAKRGSKDYGAVTLLLQWYTRPELLFNVPSTCFMPRPRVESAVLHLKAIDPPYDTDPDRMFCLIRAGFALRRKTLQNNLAALGISKQETAEALTAFGLTSSARAEDLTLENFAALANRFSIQ